MPILLKSNDSPDMVIRLNLSTSFHMKTLFLSKITFFLVFSCGTCLFAKFLLVVLMPIKPIQLRVTHRSIFLCLMILVSLFIVFPPKLIFRKVLALHLQGITRTKLIYFQETDKDLLKTFLIAKVQ